MLVDFEREELNHAVNKLGLLLEVTKRFSPDKNTYLLCWIQHAQNKGVRVLVDAEQTYFQPAISYITVNRLMPRFNQDQPIIFNTIQGYLKVRWRTNSHTKHRVKQLVYYALVNKLLSCYAKGIRSCSSTGFGICKEYMY